MSEQPLDSRFEAYFRSGNNMPVTRATIPWPGMGTVIVDALRKDSTSESSKR